MDTACLIGLCAYVFSFLFSQPLQSGSLQSIESKPFPFSAAIAKAEWKKAAATPPPPTESICKIISRLCFHESRFAQIIAWTLMFFESHLIALPPKTPPFQNCLLILSIHIRVSCSFVPCTFLRQVYNIIIV